MSCKCSPEAFGDSLREIEQSLGAARSVPYMGKTFCRDRCQYEGLWYKLVEVYNMKRDLTYDSDRLPALVLESRTPLSGDSHRPGQILRRPVGERSDRRASLEGRQSKAPGPKL